MELLKVWRELVVQVLGTLGPRARRCNKFVGVAPPPEIGEDENYIIVPEH